MPANRRGRGSRKRRFLQEVSGPLILRYEQLDLPPQFGILPAYFIEKSFASFRRPLQRSVEELFGSPLKIFLHARLRTLRRHSKIKRLDSAQDLQLIFNLTPKRIFANTDFSHFAHSETQYTFTYAIA